MNGTPLRFQFDPVDADLVAARECESDVFLQTYGNTVEQFAEEYGQYESATGFMAVFNEAGVAVAAVRFIKPGPAGLKTLNDVSRAPWNVDGLRSARAAGLDPDRTWDIATIAVRRNVGNWLCAAALYHGLISACRANGIDWIVMIMDERARRLLMASSLVPTPLPGTGPGPYLGSAVSTPLFGNLAAMFDAQRRLNPDAYRLIFLGVGLDGIAMPSPDGWRLTARESVDAWIGASP